MSKKKLSLIFSLILLGYYYFSSYSSHESILGTQNAIVLPTATAVPVQVVTGNYTVTKVVDGDTIKVSDGVKTITVRLIGVDTPETVDPRKTVQCFGKEASAFTKSLLEGQIVTLQSDPTQSLTDKYGRTLAYVTLTDGTLVNEKIIRSGYGYEYTYDVPYRYQAEFKAAQKQAEAEGVGLWSMSTCAGKR